ncbi:helix-turn-helix transcriptional regulator [Nocardia yamanashiensis]|uniref:helix-turn-helix domain-containing protein n=1 Tax=Nocardia yamanashiensis TaxID=209247 RepID=UPI001E2996DF|nr:helix-turn-helix domain-containing protein [Nocardia yamanashiensis]UGT42644.1 helix-turn-helix transcriptional regulator [Nocardia yamanashiensis]
MDEAYLAIAGFLRERRMAARLTRAELARKAGVSEALIQKLEQGTRPPTSTALHALFQALDVPAVYREYAAIVLQPELTAISNGIEPTEAELDLLDCLPHPACYQHAPGMDLIAANAAYLRAFPGLVPGRNIIEWFLNDPRSRLVVENWDREVHVLVQAFRHMAPGITPPERIEEIIRMCEPSPHWQRLWSTDLPGELMQFRPVRIRPPEGGEWTAMHVHILRCEIPRREWCLYTMIPVRSDAIPHTERSPKIG